MEPHDEPTRLRELLAALETRSMTMREGHVDVTEREKEKLRADISGLERRLARARRTDA